MSFICSQIWCNQCFQNCENLSKLVLPNITRVPTLGSNALAGTLIANGEGYIYLKDEFVESAKTATNWSVYASQIKPVSEMPVGQEGQYDRTNKIWKKWFRRRFIFI